MKPVLRIIAGFAVVLPLALTTWLLTLLLGQQKAIDLVRKYLEMIVKYKNISYKVRGNTK